MAESIIKASKLRKGTVLFDVTSGSHAYRASDAVGEIFPTGRLNNYVAMITGFFTKVDASVNVTVEGDAFQIQSSTTQRMRITYIGVV